MKAFVVIVTLALCCAFASTKQLSVEEAILDPTQILQSIREIVPCFVQTDCMSCKNASCTWNPGATLHATVGGLDFPYTPQTGLCWPGRFLFVNNSAIDIGIGEVTFQTSALAITTLVCGVPDLVGLLAATGAVLAVLIVFIIICCCCCCRKKKKIVFIH